MSAIEWMRSEWNDHPQAQAGWLDGIMGDIYPEEDWYSNEPTGKWDWEVKPTSERCEWPELIDCGVCDTAAQAKAKCEEIMRKANASYPHISYA